MMIDLADTDALYRALLDRDGGLDGRVFVGVTSTGIFCRLSCPARKPLRQNCRFLATVEECQAAGFRACKRCRPALAGSLIASSGRSSPEQAKTDGAEG